MHLFLPTFLTTSLKDYLVLQDCMIGAILFMVHLSVCMPVHKLQTIPVTSNLYQVQCLYMVCIFQCWRTFRQYHCWLACLRPGICNPGYWEVDDVPCKHLVFIYALRHQINLESGFLDTPDIYWEREELEVLYRDTLLHLNVPKRIRVCIDTRCTYSCILG